MKGLYEQKHYTVPTFQNEVTPVKWLKKVEMEKGDDHLLLVLDDVWSGSESLLEKFVYKMSNYKILVTSRSEFPRYGSSYHLTLLDPDNAMELFRHTASLGDKSSHIPKDLSKKVSSCMIYAFLLNYLTYCSKISSFFFVSINIYVLQILCADSKTLQRISTGH